MKWVRTRRRKIILASILIGAPVLYFGLTLPLVPVQTIKTEVNLPGNKVAGPLQNVLALTSSNSTGDVNLTVQNFTYSSPDNSTKLSASSASIHVTITPEGADSRVDLNIQFTGVGVKTPSFTGSFSSLQLTGYVLVDPATNKLIVSLVASTSVVDIIRSVLGV